MKVRKEMLIIILGCLFVFLFQGGLFFGFFFLSFVTAKVEVNTDIFKYNDYIGDAAKDEYSDKWGMNEEIFPSKILREMTVNDYKMVYYNPWDAQYLSYLVVDYNQDDYEKEVKRLTDYKSTNYLGYYGVTGFSNYELLAMEADSYQGFVYAITDRKSKIIYVEIIFCNCYMDINYNEYIKEEYLPDGFDATENNSYCELIL